MFLPIPPRIRDNPLNPFPTTRQPLQRPPVLTPHETLVVRVPVELEVFLVAHVLGDREADAEPVRGPAGAEGGARVGGGEIVGCGFCEGRAGEVGDGVDGEFDVIFVGGDGFEELAVVC